MIFVCWAALVLNWYVLTSDLLKLKERRNCNWLQHCSIIIVAVFENVNGFPVKASIVIKYGVLNFE